MQQLPQGLKTPMTLPQMMRAMRCMSRRLLPRHRNPPLRLLCPPPLLPSRRHRLR